MPPTDIVILSNGPGEISTWVRPVVKALRQKLGTEGEQVRISVILSPCPNATGKEAAIASSFPEVDRVQSAEHFLSFLLWGKTVARWDWRKRGVVLFLGGDQFFALIIAQRLGYSSVVYAEWDARWYRWIDRFGIMQADILKKIPPQYHHKFSVVGDLMADVEQSQQRQTSQETIIGLLPGSKPAKLTQGLPFCLAIAQYIQAQRPDTRFLIPVAPTLEISTLAQFAQPQFNSFLEKMGGVSAELITADSRTYLQTRTGLKIYLISKFPAYEQLSKCDICLTTVGANTAELASLGIPMVVLIPTQQLDAMRAWDGLPGLLANLPLFGSLLAKMINWLVLNWTVKKGHLYAWPNIWAKREIVPELIGKLQPETVGKIVLDFLAHPDKLQQMRSDLRQVRGQGGASENLVNLVLQILTAC
jgi:lipid-A-disaccharide synthase